MISMGLLFGTALFVPPLVGVLPPLLSPVALTVILLF